MVYSELRIKMQPLTEDFADIVVALLDQQGFEGISEDAGLLIGYIPKEKYNAVIIKSIADKMSTMGCKLEWQTSDIEEKNWNEVWESNFEPVVIDNRCVVRAPFHSEFPGIKYHITIESKMSFGTGHHQTTRMMLEQILEMDMTRKQVLDMGCGTGVLAILSSLKGADQITAIDIDEWAVENTRENTLKNKVENIEVIKGGKESIPFKKYDVILANINRNILIDQIGAYASSIVQNGLLILSGILTDDISIICEEATKNGFKLINKKQLGNWLLLMFESN